MKKVYVKNAFRKIIVPVFKMPDSGAALEIARMITKDSSIFLAGIVEVNKQGSISKGAYQAQELRLKLRQLMRGAQLRCLPYVAVSNCPWEEFLQIVHDQQPDLIILEWSCHFDWLQTTPFEAFRDLPCDILLVRGPIPNKVNAILVPVRGGPHAELAIRITLAVSQSQRAAATSLHIFSESVSTETDAPFRGINRVLKNLPEFEKLELASDDPAVAIMDFASRFDLIVMGASAQSTRQFEGLGVVARRLLENSPTGMVVVKTHRPMKIEPHPEAAGSQAISVLVDRWFAQNTYHAKEFSDLGELVWLKRSQNLTISVALPALNEAETVGKVIQTIKEELMDRNPLLDEIVLIDSDSQDETRQIAASLGIPVYIHQQVLPEREARPGKGEALWKSLYVTKGDIVLWIDTDIVNIHPRFIYGLAGPLLANPNIQFVKGFYRRPIKVGERLVAGGGGRVTELTARPLLNLFFPELSGLIQPLSGEYGGRRSLLEKLPFFSGFGVEIGLLIDVFKTCGLDCIAQVDLQERVHHNQSLEALSKMSFAIIQAVTHKLDDYSGYSVLEDVNRTMKLIRYESGRLFLEVEEISELERPPMIDIPEYIETRKT